MVKDKSVSLYRAFNENEHLLLFFYVHVLNACKTFIRRDVIGQIMPRFKYAQNTTYTKALKLSNLMEYNVTCQGIRT